MNDKAQELHANAEGYLVLNREWSQGDTMTLSMDMPVRVVMDRLGNPGRVALVRGPLVNSADGNYLADGMLLDDVVLHLDGGAPAAAIRPVTAQESGYVHLIAPSLITLASAVARGVALPRRGRLPPDGAGRYGEAGAVLRRREP